MKVEELRQKLIGLDGDAEILLYQDQYFPIAQVAKVDTGYVIIPTREPIGRTEGGP